MKKREDQKPESSPSIKASIKDGVSNAVMLGCGESYFNAFSIFLRASTLQVGLLATMPQLFGAIMQWLGALNLDRLHRRRLVIILGASTQAVTLLPIGLLPFLFSKNNLLIPFLLILMMIYYGANGYVVPAWNSLIGDLVKPAERGLFFGHRNRLTGMSTFLSLSLTGLILYFFEKAGISETGFLVAFSAAFIARLDSVRWLSRYDDPEFLVSPDQVFTFRQFLRRSPHSNFAKFVFFVGAVNLGVAFSAPYFALYMLRDLGFSYIEYTVVIAVSTIAQFLTFRHWGSLSDRFGNKKILNVCGWGVGLVPILWLFSSHIIYLMVIQVFSGLVWSGFSLASANFIFDAVTPPKRARCVAYQGLVNGILVFIGSIMGGYTALHLPQSLDLGLWIWKPPFKLLTVFLISGIMRLAAATLFLPKFKEVRPVEAIGHGELVFRVSHIKLFAEATFSLFTGLFDEQKGDGDGKD
jgi:MFS family permease